MPKLLFKRVLLHYAFPFRIMHAAALHNAPPKLHIEFVYDGVKVPQNMRQMVLHMRGNMRPSQVHYAIAICESNHKKPQVFLSFARLGACIMHGGSLHYAVHYAPWFFAYSFWGTSRAIDAIK